MKILYDHQAERRQFHPGDKVLELLPVVSSPFQTCFSGPYIVEKCLSECNYLILPPDRRKQVQLCHVNLLKPYYSCNPSGVGSRAPPDVSGTSVFASSVCLADVVGATTSLFLDDMKGDMGLEGGEDFRVPPDCVFQGRLNNSRQLKQLMSLFTHLSCHQQAEMTDLIHSHLKLFSETPTRTNLIEHDIGVGDAVPILQRFYRASIDKKDKLSLEVEYMLDNGIAEHSSSPWSSPCLLVIKPDGTFRFCTDFRNINAITRPDSYLLPRMEDCVDQIGGAAYVTKLDLLKGYWQVPLTPRAKEICSFIMPGGLYSYNVMPYSYNVGPIWMMWWCLVTPGTSMCHVLRAVFDRLLAANLTVNLAKCEFGRATVTYLGRVVGRGEVRPVQAKLEAVIDFPQPQSKKELMRFLGMAGFYRSFCRNFSTVVALLTALLGKQWNTFGHLSVITLLRL